MKKNLMLVQVAAALSIVCIAVGMSSCGGGSKGRAPSPGPSPEAAANPAPQAPPGPETEPAASETKTPPQGGADSSPNGEEGVLLADIRSGRHNGVGAQEKARLLTAEAQRCRQQESTVVPVESGFVEPDVASLIRSYEAKHAWVNVADGCRYRLGLVLSSGPRMKRENLIRLENCHRLGAIDKISDFLERNATAELLLVENLTLLCRMAPEQLTSPVQEALAAGFLAAWDKHSELQ